MAPSSFGIADMLDYRPGNAESVKGTGSPSDLIQDQKGLLEVALRKMFATSFISTIKVDCPLARSSDAPTRVKIRSTIPIFADFAGTKHPICAMSTISARLAHIGRFSCHIRTGNDGNPLLFIV